MNQVDEQTHPPLDQIVGRAADIQQLEQAFATALRGERQLVFVTGEPGIGKTTLVDAFLAAQADRKDVWIGRGQSTRLPDPRFPITWQH